MEFSAPQPMPDASGYLARAISLAGQVPAGAPDPATIRKVGVVGAGTMGRGIALAFAQSGRNVVLIDPSEEALGSARRHISKLVERQVAKGRISADEGRARIARIATSTRISGVAGSDLAVEAVPEVISLKKKVLVEIEAYVAETAWLTSNTSTLDVDAISADLQYPERFLGTHFFLPAQVNQLLELVPAKATSPQVQAGVLALALDINKQAVVAPNTDGFIGNRLFDRFHQEAMYLVEEGALPQEVDLALEAWGFAIGPFRTLDMIGNDVPWGVRQQRALRVNPPFQPHIGDALCEAGYMGQKTGSGWYFYDETTPKGRPYEDVQALIVKTSRSLGITRRRISPEEIVGRIVTALLIEAVVLQAEGGIRHETDIDMVYVTGYGFPPQYGGPMRLANQIGHATLSDLAKHYGALSGRSDTAWRLPLCLVKKEAVA